jgi:hypothetical protein
MVEITLGRKVFGSQALWPRVLRVHIRGVRFGVEHRSLSAGIHTLDLAAHLVELDEHEGRRIDVAIAVLIGGQRLDCERESASVEIDRTAPKAGRVAGFTGGYVRFSGMSLAIAVIIDAVAALGSTWVDQGILIVAIGAEIHAIGVVILGRTRLARRGIIAIRSRGIDHRSTATRGDENEE